MVTYKGIRWEPMVTRNVSFFDQWLDTYGQYFSAKPFLVAPRRSLVILTNRGTRAMIMKEANAKNRYVQSLERLVRSRRFFRLAGITFRYGDGLIRASERLTRPFDRQSYRRYLAASCRLRPSLSMTSFTGGIVQPLLLKELRKKFPAYPQAGLDAFVGLLTLPDELTPLAMSQVNLLAVAGLIEKRGYKNWPTDPLIRRRLDAYLKQYGHIPANWVDDPWTREDIIRQLRTILRQGRPLERRSEMLAIHKQHLIERNAALRRLKNARAVHFSKVLQMGTTLNEYRKNVYERATLAMRPVFQSIAKRYGGAWKDYWLLTPDEVERLAFDHDRLVLDRIPERRTVTGVMIAPERPGGIEIIPARAARRLLRGIGRKRSIEARRVRVLTGMVGNPGRITGTVRVVHGRADFDDFRNGDVLVAPMTSVDYVPIMERAAAFVTDEGGVTSHASIVSREMNKPCIIGTKIATKVLKDGDRVEVDATKGVVKKLD